jgi:hypothetical protein
MDRWPQFGARWVVQRRASRTRSSLERRGPLQKPSVRRDQRSLDRPRRRRDHSIERIVQRRQTRPPDRGFRRQLDFVDVRGHEIAPPRAESLGDAEPSTLHEQPDFHVRQNGHADALRPIDPAPGRAAQLRAAGYEPD